MDIFYAATTITLGIGYMPLFWHAPWLHGRKPKEIAPIFFALSKRKMWSVSQALHEGAWIGKVSLGQNLDMDPSNTI
jgi:hypothetical protein